MSVKAGGERIKALIELNVLRSTHNSSFSFSVVPSMYLHLLSKRRRVLKRFNLSEHEIKSAQGLINA